MADDYAENARSQRAAFARTYDAVLAAVDAFDAEPTLRVVDLGAADGVNSHELITAIAARRNGRRLNRRRRDNNGRRRRGRRRRLLGGLLGRLGDSGWRRNGGSRNRGILLRNDLLGRGGLGGGGVHYTGGGGSNGRHFTRF